MLIISALYGGILFGWAKPTPVNPAMLRDRRNGELYVALAGPFSNLLMAIAGAIVVRIVDSAGIDLPRIVDLIVVNFVYFNVALGVFNRILIEAGLDPARIRMVPAESRPGTDPAARWIHDPVSVARPADSVPAAACAHPVRLSDPRHRDRDGCVPTDRGTDHPCHERPGGALRSAGSGRTSGHGCCRPSARTWRPG